MSANETAPAKGAVPESATAKVEGSVSTVDAVPQQLRRRLDASHRCEALADGRRDPAVGVDWPYTGESARRAWRHLAGCGLMSETVANVLRDVA